MLEYRIRRLPAARRLAEAYGLAGARFRWESAGDGRDVTPSQALGPRGTKIPIETGAHEEHIVADVAWAAAVDQSGHASPPRRSDRRVGTEIRSGNGIQRIGIICAHGLWPISMRRSPEGGASRSPRSTGLLRSPVGRLSSA